jgi:hypothetical protein
MGKGTKIALGIVAGMLGLTAILCVVGVLVFRNMALNFEPAGPEEAAATGAEILDYQIPPGYEHVLAMDVLGSKVVSIAKTADLDAPMIMIMQIPSFGDAETARRSLEQSAQNQGGGQGFNMQVVESKELVVNGKPATMIISEGQTQGQQSFRQVQIVFEGKTGSGLIMISGTIDSWDSAGVDRFIRSLE